MKLVIERGELMRALGHVTSVVERRTTIPILSNVLLKASGNGLQFKATDLEREVHGAGAGRRVAAGRRDGAGPHPARHRAQAARRRRGRDQARRREGAADAHLGPVALRAADAAAGGFSRSRRRASSTHKFEIGAQRPEAPDRQDALCHLHRGDALLPQRHLSAHATPRQGRRPCARSPPTAIAWRRPSCRCRRAPRACPASSCRARPCTSCIA